MLLWPAVPYIRGELTCRPLFESMPTAHLLAAVQRCDTGGVDATLEYVTYTMMRPQTEVLELPTISYGRSCEDMRRQAVGHA
jgi:hypothetical protein